MFGLIATDKIAERRGSHCFWILILILRKNRGKGENRGKIEERIFFRIYVFIQNDKYQRIQDSGLDTLLIYTIDKLILKTYLRAILLTFCSHSLNDYY